MVSYLEYEKSQSQTYPITIAYLKFLNKLFKIEMPQMLLS